MLTMLAASLGGCATREYVDEQVSGLEARQNARFSELDKTTQEALGRAEAAGKLAEGKFVYSVVLTADPIRFRSGAATIVPEAQAMLTDLAQRLKTENKNVYLEVQGYTDAVGSAASNFRLGERRADTVLRYLHKTGIALNRMSAISYGENEPVAPNDTSDGRSANRRVVIVVLQ